MVPPEDLFISLSVKMSQLDGNFGKALRVASEPDALGGGHLGTRVAPRPTQFASLCVLLEGTRGRADSALP